MSHSDDGSLRRHFGVFQATALNVTMIVGAGVFITIPQILVHLPGPYALLAWLAAGVLILVDGAIWSELGAMLPGSGGSYLYLLEAYGRERGGRLMAFLFIWQFLISGPLEIGSGLIAMSQFAGDLHPDFDAFNKAWTASVTLCHFGGDEIAVTVNPARIACMLIGVFMLALLLRDITRLGRLTVTFSIGVMVAIVWILIEGALHFDAGRAFDFSGSAAGTPSNVSTGLGAGMILAIYAYLGYYHVCYIGDEVRDPGRTIPRSILLSTIIVVVLFAALHLAMLGTVSWRDIPTSKPEIDEYTLPTRFMASVEGRWAASALAVLLMWSVFGSAFAGLLGYSRIPYGAARRGHFFAAVGRVHPQHRIPHVALFLVGGMSLVWCFFDLGSVINALITTRIIEQFIGQIVAVVLLRVREPHRPRPFKLWLYPVPCGVALVGWLYVYVCSGWPFILLGLATLTAGVAAFFVWSWRMQSWPFAAPFSGEPKATADVT
jgi:amino acid transporter